MRQRASDSAAPDDNVVLEEERTCLKMTTEFGIPIELKATPNVSFPCGDTTTGKYDFPRTWATDAHTTSAPLHHTAF